MGSSMKKTLWHNMLTHNYEDSLGRPFTYHHRDMGLFFEHRGNPLCPCGPILAFMEEAGSIPALCARLDVVAHHMVN